MHRIGLLAMQQSTALVGLAFLVFPLFVRAWPVAASSATQPAERASGSGPFFVVTGPEESASMFEELRKRARSPQAPMTRTGTVRYGQGGDARYVAWVSTGGRAGLGVVGVFTQTKQLMAAIQTGPIQECTCMGIEGLPDVVSLREISAAGVGLHEETVRILDIRDLKTILPPRVVTSWIEVPRGKSEKIDHFLAWMDLDGDGVPEILDTETIRRGTKADRMLLASPIVRYSVLRLDEQRGHYVQETASGLSLFYPAVVDEVDSPGQRAGSEADQYEDVSDAVNQEVRR